MPFFVSDEGLGLRFRACERPAPYFSNHLGRIVWAVSLFFLSFILILICSLSSATRDIQILRLVLQQVGPPRKKQVRPLSAVALSTVTQSNKKKTPLEKETH